MTWFTFICYVVLIALTFFYDRAVKTEKPAQLIATLKYWHGCSLAIACVAVLGLIGSALYHWAVGITWPANRIDWCLNIAIGIYLLQVNSSRLWRVSSYVIISVATICLLGSLAGCAATPKEIDTVVPSGAVTVKVAVPTCGDDLAKSIFVVPHRPATLPINDLSAVDKEDYEKVSKAYQQTIQLLTEYAVSLERNQQETQLQCKAIRDQVDTLNTKTPVISVQK